MGWNPVKPLHVLPNNPGSNSLQASTVTEDNAGLIIPELARLTVAAVDTTDQSEGNLGVIATVFESTAELVEGGRGNFSLNENVSYFYIY